MWTRGNHLFQLVVRPNSIDSIRQRGLRSNASWATLRTGDFRASKDFTKSGMSIAESLESDAQIREVLERLVLGQTSPTVPIVLLQNVNDDVVPTYQTRELLTKWCSKGAEASYSDEIDAPPLLPQLGVVDHFFGLLAASRPSISWLEQRFLDGSAQIDSSGDAPYLAAPHHTVIRFRSDHMMSWLVTRAEAIRREGVTVHELIEGVGTALRTLVAGVALLLMLCALAVGLTVSVLCGLFAPVRS
ncbi:hypothetical protein BH93_22935 [Rhodococcoides fascians A25f]|uniref:lipase family protein n=1 Tax=Rhodococcoides fascians TaxID=1828 RepID=UPI0012D36240|nr:lipase family protein [Rhodococcus fascians]QII07851.1 hypothetical protein BH93_22935 [Rhodococcus fascians A25f]